MPDAASSYLCPYCKAESPPDAASCGACGAAFPWAAEIAALHGELKARETNRFRATYTLVHEVLRVARGGPAVSIEAIKGFITAMLFPRVVIVLGSLLGVLLLGLQTYVIWGQTRLLAQQAEAAQVDRADKLRARVAKAEDAVEALNDLAARLSELDFADWSACKGPPCEAGLWSVLTQAVENAASGIEEALGHPMSPVAVDEFKYLKPVARWPSRETEGPEDSTQEPSLKDVLQTSRTICLSDSAHTQQLQDGLARARRLVSRLPEAGEWTSLNEVRFNSAAWSFAKFVGRDSGARRTFSYRVGTFGVDLKRYTELIRENAESLRKDCQRVIATDLAALRAIETKGL